MPLGSLLPNTVCRLEQVSRESSKGMIFPEDSSQKWDYVGNDEKIII